MAIRKFTKKLSAVCVMTGLGFSAVFAADIKANIMLRGDLVRVEKDEETGDKDYSYLSNNSVNQKDNPGDGLIIEVDNGNAGAHMAMWYKTATNNGQDQYEDDDWTAHFRRTYVWFKPVDTLTVRAGYVGNDTFFKEKIDEWKVGSPFSAYDRDWGKRPVYINCNDVEGWGFGLEYRPIESLLFNAGITPGKKGTVENPTDATSSKNASFENKAGDTTTWVAPWGVGARYWWDKFEFQASFRDGGMDANRNGTWCVLRFGAGYTDEMTYSFIQPIFGLEYNSKDEKWEMNGMCLDMYSEININALKLYLHAPVTFRWGDAKTDINYMEFTLKAEYNTGSHGNLDDVKPYIQLGSNQEASDTAANGTTYKGTVPSVWALDSNFGDSFNMSYKVGLNFMISGAEIDFGVKYDQVSEYYKKEFNRSYILSVPFLVKIKSF